MRRRLILAGLVAASLAVGLLAAEGVLRIMGFTFELAPRVEFGWPNPEGQKDWYRADPDLFWVSRDHAARLAALAKRRQDVLLLGDSCTESGNYPEMFLELLRREHPGRSIAGGKIAASGWSSYQGLQLLKRDVVPLVPRVVTLYFGWNDHWVGFGIEDDEVHQIARTRLAFLPDESRTAQLLFKTRLASRVRDKSGWPKRVPPEKYRANLTEMARVAVSTGIIPVFLTAPTSHQAGKEPPYLAERFLRDLSELVPLHRQYVEITREVAAAEQVPLCDLYRRFEEMPPDQVRDVYFKADGIHATPEGGEKIAQLMGECFARDPRLAGLWSE
ncbi:MAG TPA: GDSL-type esterase/lipase family protein [Candidatus Polarisedimenticolia bacterium]|jgi:lysophospholipase L1-like esterase